MVGVGKGATRGRADQECRGARALREDRHARRRQDRHADRRQAARRRGACRPTGFDEATVLSLGASLERVERASARRRDRRRGARNAGVELARRRPISRRSPARASPARSAAGRSRSAMPSLLKDLGVAPAPISKRAPTRCGATARPRCSSPSTASRPASSPSPIRSRRRRRRRSQACGRTASASSC